ncbi:hypothetical protein [Alistipes sp.]|uniref:hypothetical protein n=1 Tax=Alistipes sp. TaxID=1872444 RepID=UPI003AB7C11B
MDEIIAQLLFNQREFIHRWNNKADLHHSDTSLSAVFDEFITRYIVYNALYKLCALKIDTKGDQKSATEAVYICLQDNISEIIPLLDSQIHLLHHNIRKGNFQIHIGLFSRKYSDKHLLNDMDSANEQIRFRALLRCIYQLRCNLFHGNKNFEYRQVVLLKPATECLRILNNQLYDILSQKYTIA